MPLDSPRARDLLAAHGCTTIRPGTQPPDSVVLLAYGRCYERSDAALHVALGLRAPWPAAFAAILIPRAWRDAAYDWIARNRYRWFGRLDACPLPDPRLRERFLDPASQTDPTP